MNCAERNVIREPKLYDLFNSGCREDIQMYPAFFQKTSPILELGVGTGRLAIPLAEQGYSVVGIDNSKEMLGHLQSKLIAIKQDVASRIRLIEQDFCKLSLDEKFDYACYPFCTFNYLLTYEQQINALSSLYKTLTKNATVVFDLMTIHTFHDMLNCERIVPYDTTHDAELDLDVIISTQGFYNQSTQIYSQERLFKYYSQNDIVFEKRVRMINRIVFWGEFQLLLDKSGFRILDQFGSYRLTKFSSTSESLIVIATPVN